MNKNKQIYQESPLRAQFEPQKQQYYIPTHKYSITGHGYYGKTETSHHNNSDFFNMSSDSYRLNQSQNNPSLSSSIQMPQQSTRK